MHLCYIPVSGFSSHPPPPPSGSTIGSFSQQLPGPPNSHYTLRAQPDSLYVCATHDSTCTLYHVDIVTGKFTTQR